MNTDFKRKGAKVQGHNGDAVLTKPPVGLKPWWLHDEQRLNEICGAIDRYLEAGKAIPNLWLREMIAIITQEERRRGTEQIAKEERDRVGWVG